MTSPVIKKAPGFASAAVLTLICWQQFVSITPMPGITLGRTGTNPRRNAAQLVLRATRDAMPLADRHASPALPGRSTPPIQPSRQLSQLPQTSKGRSPKLPKAFKTIGSGGGDRKKSYFHKVL